MFIYFSYIHAVFPEVITMHSCSFQVHITFCTCKLQLSHSCYFSPRIYVIISMPLCNLKLRVYQNLILKFKFWYVVPIYMFSIEVVGRLPRSIKMFCDMYPILKTTQFCKTLKVQGEISCWSLSGLCASWAQWPLAP